MVQSQITVLGECVADAFVDATRATPGELSLRVLPGGGPANTAVTLGRLGTPVRFLGRISHDVFGALFRSRLTASGVDLTDCVEAAESSTLAVASLDAGGGAVYSFHAEGSADWQWSAAELAAVPLEGTTCLHTGSLALIREPGGSRVEEFLTGIRERLTVSIDPNVRPGLVDSAAYRARLANWCALADILRLSEDDLGELMPGVSPEQACDDWHAAGVPLVVTTLGGRGALASLNGRRVAVPVPATKVVDTVGAGDSFTGGLLHRLNEAGSLGGRLDALTLDEVAEACAYAAQTAALTCSVPGPNPPWRHQLDNLDNATPTVAE